ncbi:MAG TPA: hypothetical protein VM597_40130 [Gemmataceae bacterium]|nr:hypothetical protein [Gemmataceae bacterium]
MATFRLRRLAVPHTLQALRPTHLFQLLSLHQAYFSRRGIPLPANPETDLFDYDRLAGCFMDPIGDTPQALIDALYLIDELATDGGMDALFEADPGPHDFGPGEATPADVALAFWLRSPDLVERVHAERRSTRKRSFEYFQPDRPNPGGSIPDPEDVDLVTLAADLGPAFAAHNRGAGCRVTRFHRDGDCHFMIRHGEPFQRVEAGDAEPTSVAYRPAGYAAVVFDPITAELGINAQAEWERQAYLQGFGRALFRDPAAFPNNQKYTLDPLRANGEACLFCADVPGLEWVRLREAHFSWGGPHRELEILKAEDLFAARKLRECGLPTRPRLFRAGFELKFGDGRRPRAVSISPPNVAQYVRGSDARLVEDWLAARGFLRGPGRPGEEADDPLVVDP